ncbi:hypothetical protein [Helicobacter bilis]|uniref:Uncharacterized protein n=2 Tax=Helicobacter bilis TaxID=37372 RepID=A0A6D2CAS7_9HELI|nr:hypothetical protein [Helicobacter bilis]EMZ37211.1 hypothetical protein C826_02208 [Helicobacter bilis WiWa]TLE03995.1 hypothetical protein LS77_007525 [Helicobacter bilis]TLE04720.1 hypothetical protein LS76_007565 [Helicobacter bilis]
MTAKHNPNTITIDEATKKQQQLTERVKGIQTGNVNKELDKVEKQIEKLSKEITKDLVVFNKQQEAKVKKLEKLNLKRNEILQNHNNVNTTTQTKELDNE